MTFGDELFPDEEDFTSTDGSEEDVIDEPEDDGSIAESDDADTGEAYDTTSENLDFGEEVLEEGDDFTSSDGTEEDDLTEATVLDSVVEVEPEPVVTSEMTLPCIASVKAGDSVVIALVNGEPTVIGAAGYGDAVDESITTVNADVAELGIVVAGKASVEELNATQANIDTLAADVAKIDVAKIEDLQANALTADSAIIKTLQADIAKVDTAAIDELKVKKADIDLANVSNAWIQDGVIIEGSIGSAAIHDGAVTNAKIADASITDAKIDSLSADSITTGTLKTERLILVDKDGSEGIITKINQLDGVLDGAAIVDDSISAAKVDVADLSAFEATIGGFDIDSSSVHSKKTSITDGTPGVFVGTTGIGLGDGSYTNDGSSPLQAYADGTFKLHGKNGSVTFNPVTGNIEIDATNLNIRSDEITFGSKTLSNTVQEAAESASSNATSALTQAETAQSDAKSALTKAESAASSASSAMTKAESAQTAADTAKKSAESASTDAASALTKAEAASSSASSAMSKAESAQTTADTAKSTADSVKDIADTAYTNASNALNSVDEAKSLAENANSAASAAKETADSVKSIADTANSNATSALQSASEAKGMAEEASNIASGAMEQADSLDESVAGIVSNINNMTGDLYGTEGEDGRLAQIEGSITAQVSELEQSTASSLGSIDKRLDNVESSVAGVAPLSAYVRIATATDGTKYILIGNSSSPFQTKFTNEEIQFLNGDVKVAYVSHDTLEIMNANIQENLTFGDWRWKEESNGNLTLRYIG